REYEGDLIVGAARDFLSGGTLFRFNLKSGTGTDRDDQNAERSGNRRQLAFSDPRLNDGVADNLAKFEITESESLLFGTGFGIGTDIHTGPNGNLFVVSLSRGAIYEIFRRGHGRTGNAGNEN